MAEENRKGAALRPPIESIVVLLGGREEPWPSHGSYRTSPPNAPFSGVVFRIEAVYQRTVAEIVARGGLWLAFAPLAIDADERRVAEVLETLREREPRSVFEEVGVAMTVMADADCRKRGLGDVVRSLLPRELVMRNWIYQEGMEKGLETGLAQGLEKGLEKGLAKGLETGLEKGREEGEHRTLLRLFERRLGRPLSAAEHARLGERIHTQGAEKIADLVIDLSADDLATWLAATNGH